MALCKTVRIWLKARAIAGLLAVVTALWATAYAREPVRPATPPAEAPVANLPAQKIGPNDLIALSVYNAPEFSRTIRVSAEGEIRLPMLKRAIRAAGKLPGELEAAIADALTSEDILVAPAVTVTVVEYQSRPISVAGAVKNPVTFQAAGPVTLLQAITRAGGLAPEAGRKIIVTRNEPGTRGSAGYPFRAGHPGEIPHRHS